MSYSAQGILEAHFKSAAKPAPIPDFLVGVLTETKMRLFVSKGRVLIENDSLGFCDGLVHVGGEEKVLPPSSLDDLIETGLVDGEVVRVPGVNTSLVQVDNGDLDVGTEVSVGRGERSRGMIRARMRSETCRGRELLSVKDSHVWTRAHRYERGI